MAEISVVCPVFNAEKYLHRCVDSVLSQSFRDFELLLVDDGSEDAGGRICDEYAQADTRVKVIHKANGGVSSARQAGMDAATGRYFIHIDPDDWIDPDLLVRMHDTAVSENADVVCCDMLAVFSSAAVLLRQCHLGYSQRRIAEAVASGEMSHSLCNKLILRSVYDSYGLFFPQEVSTGEDAVVCDTMFIKRVKCAFCEGVYYHYDRVSGQNSLTRTNFEKSLDSIKRCVGLLENVDGDKKIRALSVRKMKDMAKMKAFYFLPFKEFRDLYKEINLDYFFRNILKVRKREAYVALALLVRSNKAAFALFRKLKSVGGRT